MSLPFRLFKVNGHGALAAVAGVEIGGVPAAVRIVDKGRAPLPRVVAGSRPFDLDDVRAQISQNLPRPGTGEDAGEFDDFDAGQRFHGAALAGINLRMKCQAAMLLCRSCGSVPLRPVSRNGASSWSCIGLAK